MAAPFDPYHKWLGIPADQQPPNCYRLLGIHDFEDDLEVVQGAANQRTAHLQSLQSGQHAELAAKLLSEMLQAKNRLLDADDKAEYDAQLREQQALAKPARSVGEAHPPKPRSWPDGKMPSTIEEFQQCLEASRVMTADDSRRFVASLPDVKRPDTPKNLAIELLKAGKLTRHQAESVLKGKIKFLSFGEYIILEKLGQGGMGQVFKAEHRRMRRTVAIKVISGPAMKDSDAVRRFQREVHAAARLIHPNIVTAFDANEHEGVHFFVMEHVEGRDLSEIVNDEGPLPVAQAVDYVLQAARGLAYAHGKGIVHRDIKPANLLVDDEGTVKILDMGLARMELGADDGQELTNTGQVMGTVDYMAPEQAEDTHAVDARADIYSLGCTLYRLLSGQVLYNADTIVKKLIAHRTKPIPTLGSVCAGVPAPLEATFQKMVAKLPDDRQPTMAHVVADLEICLRGSSLSGPLPGSAEATADFSISDVISSPGSRSGKPSSSAVAPRAEKTQTAATEVTQDFTQGDTGISLGAGLGNVAPSTAGPPTPTAAFPSLGAGIVPAVISPSIKSRLTKNRLPLLIAAALASLSLIAAGIVIFLPTAEGTIRVEINDPSIEVTVAATGYTIKGKTEEIHIKPGDHTLHIKTGDLEFDTSKFVLGKGENPAVKVELLPDKVQVVRNDGKVIGEKPRAMLAQPAKNTGDEIALEFDGKSSMVVAPSIEISEQGPWTIEAWVTPHTSDRQGIVFHTMDGIQAALNTWHAGRREHTWGGQVANFNSISANNAVVIHRRVHLACVWHNGEYDLYLDGQRQRRAPPVSGFKATGDIKGIRIGAIVYGKGQSPTKVFDGLIDEFRVSKIVRYDKDFTPQPRFEPDSDTLALYHCDEGQGDELKDSSGNGHHGKIVGAKWVRLDQAAPPARTSLSFDENSEVRLPSLQVDLSQPFTIETWATSLPSDPEGRAIIRITHLTGLVLHSPARCVFQFEAKNTAYGENFPVPHKERVHLAGVRDANELRVYVNGKISGRQVMKPDSLEPKFFPRLGGTGKHGFVGSIDQVRISQAARYNREFTPQSHFTSDADTLALYHFDEGQGDVLKDSSGNGHHGKIVGAKWVSVAGESTTASLTNPQSPTSSWTDLFNNRDLTGWTPKGHNGWSVKDGVLTGETQEKVGWLMSDREYDNFELEFEYRLPPGGNSGVFLRAAAAGQISGADFHEIQLLDDSSPKFTNVVPQGRNGAIFSKIAPTKAPIKAAGEWRKMHARVSGQKLVLTLDDVQIIDSDFPADRPSRGHIGLQLYNPGIAFRNMRLRELTADGAVASTVPSATVGRMPSATPASPNTASTLPASKSALDFNYQLDQGKARVELPAMLPAGAPFTVEMYATSRSAPETWTNRQLFNAHGAMGLKQLGQYWTCIGPNEATDDPNRIHLRTTIETWRRTHLACVQTVAEVLFFANGRLVGKKPIPKEAPRKATVWILGGHQIDYPEWFPFDGTIDEVRISKGARFADNFTPGPKLTADQDTVGLYDFSEAQGEVLNDSSDNNHHGKIIGAKWVRTEGSASAVAGRAPSATADGRSSAPLPAAVPADFALQFDGQDDYAEIPSLKYEGDHPLTVEAYVTPGRITADEAVTQVMGKSGRLGLTRTKGGFNAFITAGSHYFHQAASGAQVGEPTHVAAVWDGQYLQVFANGRPARREPEVNPPRIHNGVSIVGAGYTSGQVGQRLNYFAGQIDELRVSKVARYEKEFMPAKRFTPDADTLALYHFDEGQGDVLKDSSGNNHHGKIIGAKWVNSAVPSATSVVPNPKSKIENPKSSPTNWTHRAIAEWTIQRGGKVWIGGTRDIAKVDDLPPGTWRLNLVDFAGIKSIGDDEAALISNWPDIGGITIAGTSITDAGLRHLGRLSLGGSLGISGTSITGEGFDAFAGKPIGTIVLSTNYLARVRVPPCPITPAGWRRLAAVGRTPIWYLSGSNLDDTALKEIVAKHPEISTLQAICPALTDASAEQLATLPNLSAVLLQGTQITDSGFSKFERSKSLRTIDIQNTKVTAAAVTTLHKALPQCKIIWNDGTVGPEPTTPSAVKN